MCFFFCCWTAAEHYLSSSNYMDCISSVTGSNGCSLNSSLKGSDLPELFSKLGLGKYTDVFQQQEVESKRRASPVSWHLQQCIFVPSEGPSVARPAHLSASNIHFFIEFIAFLQPNSER